MPLNVDRTQIIQNLPIQTDFTSPVQPWPVRFPVYVQMDVIILQFLRVLNKKNNDD